MIGILILVHQYVLEFPLIVGPNLLMLLQKLYSHIDDIVKVQGVIILQLLLIAAVGFGNVRNPDIAGFFRSFHHFLRTYHPILLPADGTKDEFCGKGFIVQSHILDDLLHHPLGIGGIVNGEASGIAHPFNVPPEDPAAGGVEGHSPDILCLRAKQIAKTLFQLIGSLVRKSNSKDAPRQRGLHRAQAIRPPAVIIRQIIPQRVQKFHIILIDGYGDLIAIAAPAEPHQIGDPVDQYRGLSAARTGKQKQRAFGGQYGLTLHIIQFRELCFDVPLAGR